MGLNKKLNLIPASETLKLNSQVKLLQKQGYPVINLTAGELDFETPLYLQKYLRNKLSSNKYTPALGLLELRREIAKIPAKNCGWHVNYQNVAVTAGAKQALYHSFQALLNPGEEVIIPTPAWVSYEQQVKLAGGKPVFVPLAGSGDIDPAEIKKKISPLTKVIVVNSPHNPTGKIFSRESLLKTVALTARRGLFILSDEIYQTLAYDKPAPSLSGLVDDKKRLIIVNGFSKSHALTGWRIGYLIADKQVIEAVERFQSHTSGNAAIISQLAALEILKRRKYAVREFILRLKKRRDMACKLLARIPGVTFAKPEGAFYIFINIRAFEPNSERFCRRLLKEAYVAAVPGEAFRAPGFIRFSFAAGEAELKQGISKLASFISRY